MPAPAITTSKFFIARAPLRLGRHRSALARPGAHRPPPAEFHAPRLAHSCAGGIPEGDPRHGELPVCRPNRPLRQPASSAAKQSFPMRSEEHTSELQSLMRISYAVFCLKKKKKKNNTRPHITHTYKYKQTIR